MKEATLIFPHQLFEDHPALSKGRKIYLVEHPHFFTRYRFHKQKIAFHKATMLEYEQFLKEKGHHVSVISLKDQLFKVLKNENIQRAHYALLHDKILEQALKREAKESLIEMVSYESPYFMTSMERFENYFSESQTFHFTSFYREQRHYFKILLTKKETPVGGKLTFDTANRKKLPATAQIPPVPVVHKNESIERAITFASEFVNHPGDLDQWFYPINFEQANLWLDNFLAQRLREFGPYQDALSADQSVLFHSVLSPILNVGLLSPASVVEKTVAYAQAHEIPLNSLEGFIRQIIGWREYVYGIYRYHGERQQNNNYFHNKRPLPKSFWDGSTGLAPIDTVIHRLLKTAYAHHIERLMVLGNFMLLSETNPHDVYRWFMEFFIDSYDWVMIPNVYGMSQYADGGIMTTKPYIAGGNYLKKMSNYSPGIAEIIYTDLYWRFISHHYDKLAKIPRLKAALANKQVLNGSKLKEHVRRADLFLKELSIRAP